MTVTPRLTERLLSALGASEDFREGVLGDLAEEFALRATYDGVPTARRWYWREALRAAPYLLRDAFRQLRARDLRSLASVVGVSFISVEVFKRVFFGATLALLSAVGIPRGILEPVSWLTAMPYLLLNAITPTVGGYIAARLYKRAPLIGALALGVVWLGVDLAVIARYGDALPALYRYGAPVVVMLFTTAGGILRACRLRSQLS